MDYIKTGNKRHKDTGKNAVIKEVQIYDSKYVMLGLIIKHKFGLLVTYAIVLTIVQFLPFLPSEIINLLSISR